MLLTEEATARSNGRFPIEPIDPSAAANVAKGHHERLPPPRLSGRCGFGEGTFAETRGNEEDAPIPTVRGTAG
jgi:hypothetical protein